MPSNFSTSNRAYNLKLHEYEEDDLLIEEMSGHEAMSQLFEFHLRLLSGSDDIDPRKIIAKPAILRIEGESMDHMGGERHWNGVVSRFKRTGRTASAEGEDLYTYECDIVPWFWFMTQHEDHRIFQNKTVREIIEDIFREFAYSDFKMELTESHPSLEYCTQYHETTFDFISRLCEREGIHYYFRHNESEETKHILVFTDNNASNPALEPDSYPFHHEGHAEGGADAILSLSMDQQMRTRKVTLRDWDFSKKKLVQQDTPTMLSIGEDRDLERYRYPGGFVEPDIGSYRSRVIMEAEEASHMRFQGHSQIRTLAPGHRFSVTGHPLSEFNIEYVVLSVWHHGRNNLDDSPVQYTNEFTLQPKEVTWRAPLSTPKGIVRGPQTALVTGPAGEEIHTDQYGRIRIQFHWDRLGKYDDKSSCWVRVAQVWAGNDYGAVFIPRVGMEVMVDFLEGDPDQPLVTGCVYNGVNKPPYAPPGPGPLTRSGLRTLSSKGGGGTNELYFEDKKGSEEVFLQAEKDFNVNVKANRTESVGGDSNHKIGGKHLTHIGGDRHLLVDGASYTKVKGEFLQGSSSDLQVLSEQELRLLGKTSVCMATKGTMDIHGGQKLVIEAGAMISLKVKGSGIVIDPSGVSVVGPMIKQNSGGAPSAAISPSKISVEEAHGTHGTEDGTVTDPTQQLQAEALRNAALSAAPFCAECEAARAAYQALMA